MVPDRLGPVEPFALAQVLEDSARFGDLLHDCSQDSDKELEGDRTDMRRSL